MTIVHRRQHLSKKSPRLFLLHPLICHDVIEQFSAADVLHRDENAFLGLVDVINGNNVRVVQKFEERNFAFQTGALPGRRDVGFVDDFDSDLLSGRPARNGWSTSLIAE